MSWARTKNDLQLWLLLLLILIVSNPNWCIYRSGCVLLSFGQDKFHDEAKHTLHYVVNQSDYTVQTLRNVTGYLSLAKTINVAQMLLPSDIMKDIDNLNVELNTAADTLSEKTNENSIKIQKAFNVVYAITNFTPVQSRIWIWLLLHSAKLHSFWLQESSFDCDGSNDASPGFNWIEYVFMIMS